ncbi:MAG TPA: hypothetical protein DEB15_08955 [Pusillimonas sp.]|jgi:hypothetical protein|nr:hypothetical protein [Pusillimonas sp.]HCN71747.1 hypothetical protein [Pusillimonas sp.]HCP76794.1 hypothetical protein [Pusillimonas sp.]
MVFFLLEDNHTSSSNNHARFLSCLGLLFGAPYMILHHIDKGGAPGLHRLGANRFFLVRTGGPFPECANKK